MTTHTDQNIPEWWRETTLGEVVGILDWDRWSNYPNWDDFTDDGFCLFLNTKNVPNTKFSFSEKMFITEEKDKQLRKWKLQRWDYIMTTRWTIWNFAYYNQKILFDHIRINSGMIILRIDKSHIDEAFFGQYLDSALFRHQFTSLQSGSAVPQLPIRDIKTFSIILPPLPEQRAIADMLSSFDAKIELLSEQNATLEKTAQTIFHEWFGQYSVENPEELPEGWRVGELGEEFDILMWQSPDWESYNEKWEGTVFFQGRTDFMERFPTVRLYTTEPKRIAEKFDVLVSVRAPVGDINIATETCCIWRGLATVRSKYKSYCLYKIKSLKESFDKFESEWTVFGSINKDAFNNIEVIIPLWEKILQFEEMIKPIDARIYNNYQEVQTISKTRDELLPRLMSGEIRVI